MDLSAFNDYEREFLSLTSTLPGRVTSLTNYSDPEQATSEIRRLDSDLTQAKQRVCDRPGEREGVRRRPPHTNSHHPPLPLVPRSSTTW